MLLEVQPIEKVTRTQDSPDGEKERSCQKTHETWKSGGGLPVTGGGQFEHVTYRHTILGITSHPGFVLAEAEPERVAFSHFKHMTRLHDSAVGRW